MLTLSRGTNESIVLRVGGQVIAKITLLPKSRPGRIRLGVAAEDTVTIHREEVDRLLHPEEYAAEGEYEGES